MAGSIHYYGNACCGLLSLAWVLSVWRFVFRCVRRLGRFRSHFCQIAAGMLRGTVSVLIFGCAGAHGSAQPVLNVIAEPPLAVERREFANDLREVSVIAANVARHAGERRQAMDEHVGAMFVSEAPTLSAAAGSRPVALLGAGSALDSGHTPELHILPPVQDDRDVLAELDTLMQAEQAKRKLADEIFAGDKQRMLDVEKAELRRIIRDVFA